MVCGQSFVKANDQLRRWFSDDEALERAISGEYVQSPSIYEFHSLTYLLLDAYMH